ncbi:MAG: hypothetical protein IPN44_08910 [Flavobacteriales bacterium]|nr:hypothetical protein [Flavobacteriales bacterium]
MHLDPSKAILIFASPRGGSTWLEEILATIPGSATLWEPLNVDEVRAFKQIGFAWRQHIPEQETWPEAEQLFRQLFQGRLLSPYLAQATSLQGLKMADRAIVKFVRGHLLLPWLIGRFSPPRPVLLVRHPCAVVSSMLKHGAWNNLPVPPPVPAPHRYDERVRSYHALAGTVNTIEERLALIWCMDHAYLLQHPQNDLAWTTITYEELVLRTPDTLAKVFAPWGMEVPALALQRSKQPSRTSPPGPHPTAREEQLTAWQRSLSAVQQERVIAMVERFGIDLYGRDALPLQSYTP